MTTGVTLTLSLVWVVTCTFAFGVVLRGGPGRLSAIPTTTILGLAFLVRLLPALFLRQGASYEMALFQSVGTSLLAGERVLGTLPYLPCFVYWMALADWLSRVIGLDFTFWLKLPSIVADVILVSILYTHLASRGWSRCGAHRAATLYALNPVSILVSAYHGQFDVIPTMLLMLSLALWEDIGSKRRLTWASLSLGAAILVKTWPGIAALCVIFGHRSRRRIPFLVGSALVPLTGVFAAVYLSGGRTADLFLVLRRALEAGAVPGWWGYTGMVNGVRWLLGEGPMLFDRLVAYKLPLVFVPVVAMVWLTRKSPLRESVLWSLVTLFVVAPGLGLQSLSWLVPLLVLRGNWRDLGWYVGLGALHMVITYWGIHFIPSMYQMVPSNVVSGIVQISAVPVWMLLLWFLGRQLWSALWVDSRSDCLQVHADQRVNR